MCLCKTREHFCNKQAGRKNTGALPFASHLHEVDDVSLEQDGDRWNDSANVRYGGASRLGTLRKRYNERDTIQFVQKLKADLQEAQDMLEVGPFLLEILTIWMHYADLEICILEIPPTTLHCFLTYASVEDIFKRSTEHIVQGTPPDCFGQESMQRSCISVPSHKDHYHQASRPAQKHVCCISMCDKEVTQARGLPSYFRTQPGYVGMRLAMLK